MKLLLTSLSLLLLPLQAMATSQQGEILVYNHATNEMYSTPLESWFPRDDSDRQCRLIVLDCAGTWSSCWRGYVGTWTIRSNALFLVSVEQTCSDKAVKCRINNIETNISFSAFLPEPKTLPLRASWFTGTLRVPCGKRLHYVHMGFGSIYEKDLFIQIDKGKVVKRYEVNNKDAPATASDADLQWVALGGGPVKDTGTWFDARLIPTKAFQGIVASGTNFLTRGIFFGATTNEPATLDIPDTRATAAVTLPLQSLPKDTPDYSGAHVEIGAHFVKDGQKYVLHVDTVRLLKPGETMHKVDYKPPKTNAIVNPRSF